MPLPKYYCDYCDRAFNDIPSARRKHFDSKFHKITVKLHYDSFKDPAELLAEEAKKPPCKNILVTGKCEFGPGCRYSHIFQHFPGPIVAQVALPQLPGFKTQTGVRLPGEILPPSMLPPPQGGYKYTPTDLAHWG